MTKKEVLQAIQNPKSLTESKLKELEKIADDFPYFQGAHTLLAISYKRFASPMARKSLVRASLYASDRHFLKELLESPWEEEGSEISAIKETSPSKPVRPAQSIPAADEEPKTITEEVLPNAQAPSIESTVSLLPTEISEDEPASRSFPEAGTSQAPNEAEPIENEKPQPSIETTAQSGKTEESESIEILTLTHSQLLKEVMENLESLRKTKSNYLEVEKRMEDAEFEAAQAKAVRKATSKPQKGKPSEKESVKPVTDQKTDKKQPAAAKAKNEVSKSEHNASLAKKSSHKSDEAFQKSAPKKVDQGQIIDEFIKKSPSIKPQVPGEAKAGKKAETIDLSEPSQKLKDDLITENLALILIKQGKKEKAIEVYKKLIWKFPQKKAYFATQIEELQK